ncbi:cytochrome c oxidase assembly protein CtaG [Anaplasma platys]|uniref:Cytochrome c oxidase assembly protein CtaG n=1 Tax=Anaplasma platys TaxID=949 RepID=A0A858PZ97_9RICK|nr:cytochrome c oxidase assembly protein [Anaplasma platys]QJC27887.1 cytochrome c oxidase assembly protein CtaG [Anaplasma platys]
MKNRKANLAFLLISVVLSMLLLSYASVPLYSIFCKVTGYGGTPKKVSSLKQNTIGTRQIKVRFSATTTDIPLEFKPETPYVYVTPGIQKLAFYVAQNVSSAPISGTAIYNVSPPQAGKYFYKIACFCFTEQFFEPNKKILMPVSFSIDPAIETDISTSHIREITLSYIFMKSNPNTVNK